MPASANDFNARRHLIDVLRNDESVDAFIDWFWPALFAIHTYGTDEDVEISADIEGLLAELSGGWIDDAGLLDGLRSTAEELGIDWRPAAQAVGSPRFAS